MAGESADFEGAADYKMESKWKMSSTYIILSAYVGYLNIIKAVHTPRKLLGFLLFSSLFLSSAT